MAKISVVISAWNEEKRIAKCLTSVKWADELILVDSGSTDNTASIAKKHGAVVFPRPNNPMLNVNKNFGFSKAKHEWILSLDADEEISSEGAEEIQKIIAGQADIAGYWMSRKNIIFGKWIQHGLWWPDKQLRLFQKNKGMFPGHHVHEYVEVEGKTETLKTPFIHYNYESIDQFLRKLGLYTDNEVKNLTNAHYQLAWYDAIRFPVSDFVKIYFAQSGYKDGLHGLVLALFQSFYSFVVFAKLWELDSFTERSVTLSAASEELKRSAHEIRYWMLTTKMEETSNPLQKLMLKIKRHYA